MDRKQMLGFGLIMVLLAAWLYMNQPSEAERAEIERRRDSIANVEAQNNQDATIQPNESATIQNTPADSAQNAQNTALLSQTFGVFAPAATGEKEIITVENEELKVLFSSKGGRIVDVLLKNYQKVIEDENKKEVKVPLRLLEDNKDRFEYIFHSNNLEISSQDLYFSPTVDGSSITFRINTSNGGYLEQTYALQPNSFQIDYSITWNNIPTSSNEDITLNWLTYLDRLEKNTTFEKTYSTIHYKSSDSRPSYTSYTGDDEEEIESSLKWVSHSNQFFNTTLLTDQPFSSGNLTVQNYDEGHADLKKLQSVLALPNNSGSSTFNMKMYVGPNDYDNLKNLGHELEDIIPFGWSIFGTINRRVIRPLFNFLDGLVGSKGLAILALTLLVKAALYPITYKMLYSQAKTQALKPRMDQLKEKFKNDQKKQQMETMKLYQEYGVNPVGGCLPMLLQMPIWFALYRFFPAAIEFRQASFWWATDLSSYDSFFILPADIPFLGGHISLFTILYTISMIGYTYYNSKMMESTATGNAEMMKMMKIMQYAMPVMFFFFFNTYAAGLTAYLFFSNLTTIAQTVITKNVVINHDKINEELEAYKKKPKKTSKFRQRLEDAMKEQQKQQELKKKKK
ncbi:membrane protein insertase YidC [Membranihabitans maritimus]|uniref:membrane protein insertase YidC n=1 Tax=Membranihabitans maritimus TaxID=2904244 RepID=UPI001F0236D3|nr:membrane protein insertase YidC [Membranihabitans maritimus]